MQQDDTPTPTPSEEAELSSASELPKEAPSRIGPYRVVERIGRGGMGEVFRAEQESPVRRTVALKLIRRGMDTDEVIARFEAERQALALMNHPNIARVYDAGATEKGRPFFAMEYVRGLPITQYCDRYRLATRVRLELFLQICDGVQHAHQKGIIHRDLKPSNLLVAMQDDRPVPKIIDFGVAKAISQPLTERGLQTRLGHFLGTPEYMSPEQAEMDGLDIDTRSDVYSLGAVLYELLVGAQPFDSTTLRDGGYSSMRRRIVEDEPPRLSARLRTSPQSDSVAEKRSTDLGRLSRLLTGDLEWIVLKAMEKDRTRRYETANALALDIRRHLDDEPVRARPPSTVYRLRKFVRRNRLAVAAAALVLLAVVLGAAAATLGLLRARAAEQRATVEAETARRVSDFLVELFDVSDPSRAQGDTITARQLLDEGAARIERDLGEQPTTQARLMHTIGTVYRKLGFYDEAISLLERALELRESRDGEKLEVAASLHGLAAAHYDRGEREVARALAERALEIRRERLGTGHPDVAESLSQLGWIRLGAGDHKGAEPLFREALEIRTAALGPESLEVADSLNDVGIITWRLGSYDAAEPLLLRAIELYEQELGPHDYRVRTALNDLAALYWSAARYEDAVPLLERSIAIKERVLGPEHPEVGSSLNNLAILYDALERWDEAEPLLRRALAIKESALEPESDEVGMALANLAWVHYRQGELEQAQRYYERARRIYEARPRSLSMAILLRDESLLHRDRGDYATAGRLLRRALAIREQELSPDHPDVADALALLAGVERLDGAPEGAEPLLRRALEIRREKLAPDHPDRLASEEAYRELLRDLGRDSEGR